MLNNLNYDRQLYPRAALKHSQNRKHKFLFGKYSQMSIGGGIATQAKVAISGQPLVAPMEVPDH